LSNHDPKGADHFLRTLLEVLRAHPAGLSEYDLIKLLEADGEPGFETGCLHDSLSLFQTHFLLFHHLYRLAEVFAQEGEYRLHISPLLIQAIPKQDKDDTLPAEPDPLRAYYLDLNNLKNTAAEDVEALLSRFWTRFIGNDQRREALETLELEDPVDWPAIKQQHRRLVMAHHPDRGGDKERLQAINAAMEVLARAYSSAK
jgi:hypothetical protein